MGGALDGSFVVPAIAGMIGGHDRHVPVTVMKMHAAIALLAVFLLGFKPQTLLAAAVILYIVSSMVRVRRRRVACALARGCITPRRRTIRRRHQPVRTVALAAAAAVRPLLGAASGENEARLASPCARACAPNTACA